jgi:hypothetical protein
VPIDDPAIARGGRDDAALARASAADGAALAWSVGATVAGAFSLLSVLVLALVLIATSPPLLASAVGFLAAAAPMLLALFGRRRAKERRAEVEPALDEAWRLAAREAAEARGVVRASDLGALMRVDADQAEQLLIQLSADGAVSSRITDEGAIEFATSGAPLQRVPEADSPRKRLAAQPALPALPDARALEGEPARLQEAEQPAEPSPDEITEAEAEAAERQDEKAQARR